MLGDFKAFLTKTNALALAVGVIIGAAVGKVVTSIVEDLIMPVVGYILPGGDWREAKIPLKTVTDAAGKTKEIGITYGHFFGTVIDFIFVAFVVYMITKAVLKPSPDAPTKVCPECKETIAADATRCKACTTVLA